jgi:hypothetical protein
LCRLAIPSLLGNQLEGLASDGEATIERMQNARVVSDDDSPSPKDSNFKPGAEEEAQEAQDAKDEAGTVGDKE